jgi:hypothetical protein
MTKTLLSEQALHVIASEAEQSPTSPAGIEIACPAVAGAGFTPLLTMTRLGFWTLVLVSDLGFGISDFRPLTGGWETA